MKKIVVWLWVNWLGVFYIYLLARFIYESAYQDISGQIFIGVLLLAVKADLNYDRLIQIKPGKDPVQD